MMAFEGRFSLGLEASQEIDMDTAAYSRYSTHTILTLRNPVTESQKQAVESTAMETHVSVLRILLNAEALKTMADMMELAAKAEPRNTPNRSMMQYHTLWIHEESDSEPQDQLKGLDIQAPKDRWGVSLKIRAGAGDEETVCDVTLSQAEARLVMSTARKMAAAYEAQEREKDQRSRMRVLEAQWKAAEAV